MYVGYDGQYHNSGIQKLNSHRLKQDTSIHTQIVNSLGYQKCAVFYAGRTDAGVSASCNALILKNVDESAVFDVNSHLPFGIHVLGFRKIHDKFNLSRFTKWVSKRNYIYCLKRKDYPLINTDKMQDFINMVNCKRLDYRNLCKWDVYRLRTVETAKEISAIFERVVELELRVATNDIILTFSSSGFLRYQIRKMITVLIAVGLGEIEVGTIYDSLFVELGLDAKKVDIGLASATPLMKHTPLLTVDYENQGTIVLAENRYLEEEIEFLKKKETFCRDVLDDLGSGKQIDENQNIVSGHRRYKKCNTNNFQLTRTEQKLSDFVMTK